MFIYLVIYFSSIFCFGLFLIYNHDRASSGKCNILSAFSRFGDVINPSIFSQSSVLCLPQCSMYPFSVFFFCAFCFCFTRCKHKLFSLCFFDISTFVFNKCTASAANCLLAPNKPTAKAKLTLENYTIPTTQIPICSMCVCMCNWLAVSSQQTKKRLMHIQCCVPKDSLLGI